MSWYPCGNVQSSQNQEIENEATTKVLAVAENFAKQSNKATNTNIFQAGGQMNDISQSASAAAAASSLSNQNATNIEYAGPLSASNSTPALSVKITKDGQVKVDGKKIHISINEPNVQ